VAVGDVDGRDRARESHELSIDDVTCFTPARSKLVLRQKPGGRDALQWTWRGRGGGHRGAFGAPDEDTAYELSTADAEGELLRVAIPAGAGFWRRTQRGFSFADASTLAAGLRKLSVLTHHADDDLVARGRGPALGLAARTPVAPLRVRLANAEGACWEVVYPELASRGGRTVARASGGDLP
jgi:hypothetical protein